MSRYLVDQFPEQRPREPVHFHKPSYGDDEVVFVLLHRDNIADTFSAVGYLFFSSMRSASYL